MRPKLTIEKTKSERIWDFVGYLFYFGSIIFLIIVWNKLPSEVPAHYNAVGEVDRWGSKWELIILPCVGAFILIFMKIIEKFPEAHNYPSRFNESNAEQFYLLSRKMVNQIKNICLILFSLIAVESVLVAKDWGGGFGMWFLPITLIGTGIPIVRGIIKMRKIQ